VTGKSLLWWIKLLHTAISAVLAGSILAVPVATSIGHLRLAIWLTLAAWVEIFVLVLNGMRCPLTDFASRHTGDRADNFDIFLPVWLARHNQRTFGSVFAAAELFLLWHWLSRGGT
jgi:hypothetical protein